MKKSLNSEDAGEMEDALSWAELRQAVENMSSKHADDIHAESFNGTPHGLFLAMLASAEI